MAVYVNVHLVSGDLQDHGNDKPRLEVFFGRDLLRDRGKNKGDGSFFSILQLKLKRTVPFSDE